MKARVQLIPFVALALLLSVPVSAQTSGPAGQWDAVVGVSNNTIEIPFRFEIVNANGTYRGYFFDGDVKVPSQPGTFANGTVDLRFDQYGARLVATLSGDRLEGKYDRGTRGAAYPFRATRAAAAKAGTEKVPNISGEWRIPTKSAKGESAWRFIVRQNGANVSASILRIDGDTGALSGQYANGRFLVSHFSGARPVKYEITVAADGSLELLQNGQQKLAAYKLTDARAKDAAPTSPTQFTRMKNPAEPFRFSYPDLNGKVVSNTDERFRNKVVLISITGSWCPNCHDEAVFLRDFLPGRRERGLEVVQLMFEYTDDADEARRLVREFASRYDIDYPVLLAGTYGNVSDAIPAIASFHAYPTMLVLGRDGRILHTHTGFSGPATGGHYDRFVADFTALIDGLLAEQG